MFFSYMPIFIHAAIIPTSIFHPMGLFENRLRNSHLQIPTICNVNNLYQNSLPWVLNSFKFPMFTHTQKKKQLSHQVVKLARYNTSYPIQSH